MPWNHKIVETWLWIHKYKELPQFIQPIFIDNEYPDHIKTLVYSIWMDIGPDTLFSILHYLDLVPWNNKKSRRMALAQYVWWLTTILFFPIVEYTYFGSIYTYIYFWVNIGQYTLIPISQYLDLVFGTTKIVGKWL